MRMSTAALLRPVLVLRVGSLRFKRYAAIGGWSDGREYRGTQRD